MSLVSLAAALVAGAALAVHALTALLAWRRCRPDGRPAAVDPQAPAVSIVRPVRGLDDVEVATLASSFAIDHARYEIVFCAESEDDPAVAFLNRLIAANPRVPARLLIGVTTSSINPKLDNVEKGWNAARHDWIVLADANVSMPRDYVSRLLGAWRADTGLVSAPPIGASPRSFPAEIECAFLNTYQARWQYAIDWLGHGFAHGKNLLLRKSELEAAGGIRALSAEVAEDAAATKLLARAGRRVRLADRPFAQPLGSRTLKQVWDRQVRWAQLRRWSFPMCFAPEILATSLVPIAAGGLAAWASDYPVLPVALAILAFWLSVEGLLARSCGWHLRWHSPAALLTRELLLVAVWIAAWSRDQYDWHDKRVVATRRASPHAIASNGGTR